MIVGLCLSVLLLVLVIAKQGLTVGMLLLAADAGLLLYTIIAVYRSKAPWCDTRINALIWIVFGIAFLGNIIVPLIFSGRLRPTAALYVLLFSYLLWLKSAAARSQHPAQVPGEHAPTPD